MKFGVSMTYSTAVILQAIANGYQYGFDIMDATGLPSGTVYPALRRFEEAGLVRSKWESETAAQREQRPARRNYQLTKLGTQALAEAVTRYRAVGSMFPLPNGEKLSDV